MQRLLLTLSLMAFLASVAVAADANPPLLSDTPCPAPALAAVCAPPPPVCKPEPVCKPAPVCAPKVVQVPVTCVVNETRVVPVKKKVWEEECYTVNEERTLTYDEVRTRTATRNVKVPSTKEVSYVKIVKVEPCAGKAPRLARPIKNKTVPTMVTVKEEYEETYTVPVKTNYTMPVTKTRKVAREIEETKTVTVPVKVTTMETRVLN